MRNNEKATRRPSSTMSRIARSQSARIVKQEQTDAVSSVYGCYGIPVWRIHLSPSLFVRAVSGDGEANLSASQ